jgi:hypothetical protein
MEGESGRRGTFIGGCGVGAEGLAGVGIFSLKKSACYQFLLARWALFIEEIRLLPIPTPIMIQHSHIRLHGKLNK